MTNEERTREIGLPLKIFAALPGAVGGVVPAMALESESPDCRDRSGGSQA